MRKNARSNECRYCTHAPFCLLSHNSLPLKNTLDTFQFSARLLKRGEHLCYQGQYSQNLYIIRSGTLKSYLTKSTGEEFVMGFYLPTDLFGWEGIDDLQRSVSIMALEHSNICIIPTKKMLELVQQMPSLGSQLLRMVSRRIQQDNVALLRTSAQQRVATFLLQLNARYRQVGFSDHQCQLTMTHQDIANYLRMTSSTISRVFHELQEKKLITMNKHVIYLLDIPAIHLMAEADDPVF